MFENISYKKKFIGLIVLLFMLGFTAYKRSYSKTIAAKVLLNQSKEKLKQISNAKGKISGLQNDVAHLDNIIGKQATNADIVQQEILNTLANTPVKAQLKKLKKVHRSNNEYFNIYTNRLLLNGSFNDLLQACYTFEKDFDYSRVVSLSLYVEKDARTQQKKLIERIIFQNYEKIH